MQEIEYNKQNKPLRVALQKWDAWKRSDQVRYSLPSGTHQAEDGWMEKGGEGGADGGLVKTQAGVLVLFCWPELGSSPVLLQHSPPQHTGRGKVKGRQVNTHTHTHVVLLPLSWFSPLPAPLQHRPARLSLFLRVKVNWNLLLPKTTTKETRSVPAVQELFVRRTHTSNTWDDATWQRNTPHAVYKWRRWTYQAESGQSQHWAGKKKDSTNKTSFFCCWLMLLPVKQTHHNWIVVIAHHILTATALEAGRRSPPQGRKHHYHYYCLSYFSSLLLPLMLYLHDGSRIDWIISILSEYANSSSKQSKTHIPHAIM